MTEIVKNNANRPVPVAVAAATPPRALVTASKKEAQLLMVDATDADAGDEPSELQQQLSKMDIIRKFDNKYREEEKPENGTANGNANGNGNGNGCGSGHGTAPTSHQSSFEDDAGTAATPPIVATTTAASNGGGTPPKPLPRTSRNNSMSEQGMGGGGGSAAGSDDSLSERSRPVARPRTAATYKVDDLHTPHMIALDVGRSARCSFGFDVFLFAAVVVVCTFSV